MLELDFRNIIVLISLSIHAVLLWILFQYGRKSAGGRAYAVAILGIAGWVLPMFLYRAHVFGYVIEWARLLYVMSTFTSVTFFYFTLVFPNEKVKRWVKYALFAETLAVIGLLLHPTLIIKGVTVMQHSEDIILWGPLYPVFSSHISLFFLAGFYVLYKKWKKAKGILKRQIANIFWGYFFASNLAMTTNLILPWFGYFELNWLGQFFSTIVAVFTTYAILRNRLMDIKIIATEGFILTLNLFLLFQVILSNTASALILNAVIAFAVICVSYLLLISVRQEVRRRQEISHLAESLEKANKRLKILDRQKTEFLSIASHQLRTPLSIIKGYIELITDGAYGKIQKKMKTVLTDMDQSNERLVKLVDEFLNISRIEQGRTKYSFDYHDMNQLIESVVKELTDRAKNAGLRISWKANAKASDIYMDDEKVRHIVFNYIDNAIKYSGKGTIKVFTTMEDRGISVRVVDEGMGFGPEDEAAFFHKFYRGKNVEGTNVNGTGLGIYVCRQFAEAHGGHVWAHSPGPGKGSEFGFWIPKQRTKVHDMTEEKSKSSKQQVVNQYSTEEEEAAAKEEQAEKPAGDSPTL